MVTKERLHQLIEALPDGEVGTAARVLEALSGLAPGESIATDREGQSSGGPPIELPTPEEFRRRYGRPTFVEGSPPVIGTADLRGDFWPEDESVEEFDATIRRWRDADRHG